jgi:hypothetical protein
MLWDLISSSTFPKLSISQIKPSETRAFFSPVYMFRRKCCKTRNRIPGIKRRRDKYPEREDTVLNSMSEFSDEDFVKEFKNSERECV